MNIPTPQELSNSVAILAGILGIGFLIFRVGTHSGEAKHETRLSLSEQSIKTILECIKDLTKDMSTVKGDIAFIKANISRHTSVRKSRAKKKK